MKIISLKKIIFMIVLIYGIIGINNKSYAEADFSYKVVKNSNAGPTTNVSEYEICTDALMYHISANGYDKRIGDPCDDNFSIAGVGSSNSLKAKGYGWYTYKLKSLQGLIEYCHSKNPTVTNDKSNITIGTEPYTVDYNYEILVNLSESSLSKTSKDVMRSFWEGMYNEIQNEFIEYQDSYFFRENTLKAIDKIRGTLNSEELDANNLSERNLSRNRTDYSAQSKKEYLTLLTTYMYSINREEKLASVGKGDLVPFLYYAEHTGETNPYIIGKYAYVALVYEFLRVSGTNYWTAEFDRIYFNNTGFADSEIFEEYDIETLEQWYDETYEKYKNDRGVKQNPLIGSDIDTIISSNYTINYQVEATKDYIENIYAELGIDVTVDDFISKNALMAEYMMQNSNFDDVIKDYNVSIKFVVDNLQRGTFEEKNGTTAVLSDFQTIEFDDTIEKVGSLDKDNDTLTNKAELGEVKWQDITGFVEKMYQSKYGTNMTMYESKVDEMVINNGGYTDFNGNFVYGHVKKEKDILGNIKVFYRVYDYKSNPILKDTDFDGMNDNDDGHPKDNNFKGMAKIERNQNLKVDYHNDYRHFYIDNNKYNSELAEMSLMISNLANDEDRKLNIYQGGMQVGIMNIGGSHIGNMNITEYLPKIGFNPLGNISLYDGNGKCYLYYKIVNYYGEEKLVFGIFIGGFNNERAYRELVVANDNDKYQNIITSIVNQVNTLKNISSIKQYFENNKYCYWITGKNISGSIATGVATKLEGSHNTYCYTYGVPNVRGTSTLTYIKNIVNEDDLLPKIHEDIGQEGDVYNKSIYWDLIPEYRHYIESPNKYKGNFKKTNTVKQGINDALNSIIAWGTEEMKNTFNNDLSYYVWLNINGINETENSFFANTASNLISLNKDTDDIMAMREYKDEVLSGNSTKAYWCLVKVLDGYDSKYYYGEEKKFYTDKVQGMTGTQEIMIGDDELGKRDGYWFINENGEPLRYEKYKDIVFNKSNEETYKVNDFIFSNYTISNCTSFDLDFSRFWHITAEKQNEISNLENRKEELNKKNLAPHTELYNVKAGDYSSNTTRVAYGFGLYANSDPYIGTGYLGTSARQMELIAGDKIFEFARDVVNPQWNLEIYNNILNNDHLLDISEGDRLTTLDGRIVAAFPMALLSEENFENFDKTAMIMHKEKSYLENGDYKGNGQISLGIGKDKMYKYVDCVFEDVGTKHQFVVPFIVVDPKNLHHEESDGSSKKARFTDNRYGQVNEITTSHSANSERKVDGTLYSHRDDIRTPDYINPLEPYIYSVTGSSSKGGEIKDMLNTRFGTAPGSTVRLISMRIYDKYFADYKYNKEQVIYKPDALNWWTNVRDSFKLDTYDDQETLFSRDNLNIIVEYHPKICSCNN